LGSTFLSLLAQELQNQDPTAPVDATAMVGQMISLNQLQQLIDINQSLTSSTSTSTSSTKATAVQAATASADGANSTLSPSAASTASNQLPFDPSTMMPLGSGNSAALAASFNSSINAATQGLSGPSNYATGGK
jgi:flagellar basal-body rod modification protein FlgD